MGSDRLRDTSDVAPHHPENAFVPVMTRGVMG